MYTILFLLIALIATEKCPKTIFLGNEMFRLSNENETGLCGETCLNTGRRGEIYLNDNPDGKLKILKSNHTGWLDWHWRIYDNNNDVVYARLVLPQNFCEVSFYLRSF